MFKNKKVLFMLAILSIAIIGLAGWLLFVKGANKIDGVNYNPPTETELAETERHKEELANKYSNDTEQDSNKSSEAVKTVKPFVTYSGQTTSGSDIDVNGYVPNIVEKDGMCRVKLTRGVAVVTQEKNALPNVQDTTCGRISVPFEKLSPGKWKLVLEYESSNAKGSSNEIKVEIR